MSVISRIMVIKCASSDETPQACEKSGDAFLSSVVLLLDRFDRVFFFLFSSQGLKAKQAALCSSWYSV